MSISIGQHFNGKKLLTFALPSIIMMMFMSLYTIVDGIFVSRFIGDTALSAVNIVYPVSSIFVALGVMLATGGSAIIGKRLGENDVIGARQSLTLFVATGGVIGFVLSVLAIIFAEPIVRALGANEVLVPYCVSYLKTIMIFGTASVLQLLFLSYFVVASKPKLGLFLTVFGGVLNVVLDYVFLGVMQSGIDGAAFATGIGQLVPAIIGILFFVNPKHELHLSKFRWEWRTLLKACSNGSSEMVTHLANAIVTFLFNIIMMQLAGETGVAAITIILYGQFLFNSMYLGYSMGVGPIFSYHYGAKNKEELKNVLNLSLIFIGISSVLITVLSFLLAEPIVSVFVKPGTATYTLASTGFALFSINYIFSGLNIFVSSLFTAMSDGKTSAIISFLRTFLFIIVSLLVLPRIFGVAGAWLAVPVAEAITVLMVVLFLVKKAIPMLNNVK